MSEGEPSDDERRLRAAAKEILAGSSGVVRIVEQTSSTQDSARAMARDGLPAIVLARHQTAGRGRMGRSWVDAPGMGVACSIALARDALDLDELPARAGVAVCRAIEAFGPGLAPALKWPNDVVVRGLGGIGQAGPPPLPKLAGVLVEVRDNLAIIGVGINVRQQGFPPEIARASASLAMLGVEVMPIDVGEALLRELGRTLASGWSDILGAWRCRDALIGRHVRLRLGLRTIDGSVEAIEPARQIVLRTRETGVTPVDARLAQIDAILD